MKVYSVYFDEIFLKSFKLFRDACVLENGLIVFCILHDVDVGLVTVVEEDV